MRVGRSLRGLCPLVLGVLALSAPASGADYEPADPVGKARLRGCGVGFPDLGGKCWRCPPGYRHDNIFLPPTDGRACKKAGRTEYRKADKKRPAAGLNCPAGEWVSFHEFPLSCYECRDGYTHDMKFTGNDKRVCFRTNDSYSSADESGGILCDRGFFDPIDGGTCWTCPNGYYRTTRPVNSPEACTDELDGILAVDAGAVCTQIVTALAEGEQGVRRLTNTLGFLFRPVMAPLDEGARALSGQIKTPAEVEKTVERLAQSLKPYGHVVEEVPRLSDVLDKKGMELRRIMLDPQLMCRGNLAEANRRLEKLGLRPRPRRSQSGWLDGLFVGEVHAAGKHGYVAFALTWNVMVGKAPITTGLTFVTDFENDAGLLWSLGGFLGVGGLKDLAGLSGSVLVFPYAEMDDFAIDIPDVVQQGPKALKFGVLSTELEVGQAATVKGLLASIGAEGIAPESITLSFAPELVFGGAGPDPSLPGIGPTRQIPKRSGPTQAVPVSGSMDASLWIFRLGR